MGTKDQSAPPPLDQAEQLLDRLRQVLNAGGTLDPTLAQLVSAYAIRDQQVQAVAHMVQQLGEAVAAARAQAQPRPPAPDPQAVAASATGVASAAEAAHAPSE